MIRRIPAIPGWRLFTTEELLHQRYLSGIFARRGMETAMMEVITINSILTYR